MIAIRRAAPSDVDLIAPLFDAYESLGYEKDIEFRHYALSL